MMKGSTFKFLLTAVLSGIASIGSGGCGPSNAQLQQMLQQQQALIQQQQELLRQQQGGGAAGAGHGTAGAQGNVQEPSLGAPGGEDLWDVARIWRK